MSFSCPTIFLSIFSSFLLFFPLLLLIFLYFIFLLFSSLRESFWCKMRYFIWFIYSLTQQLQQVNLFSSVYPRAYQTHSSHSSFGGFFLSLAILLKTLCAMVVMYTIYMKITPFIYTVCTMYNTITLLLQMGKRAWIELSRVCMFCVPNRNVQTRIVRLRLSSSFPSPPWRVVMSISIRLIYTFER